MMLRATVTIPYRTGLPEDVVNNVFHFIAPSVVEGNFITVATALSNFYFADYTADVDHPSVASFMAPYTNLGAMTIRMVDVDPASGTEVSEAIIVDTDATTFPDPSDGNLPLEVALCMSFNATPTTSARRARGRVYLGPWSVESLSPGGTDATNIPRPSATLIEAISKAGGTLIDEASAGVGPGGVSTPWAIWSRADGVAREVVGGYVDNAWDTQRRRGTEASARTNLISA